MNRPIIWIAAIAAAAAAASGSLPAAAQPRAESCFRLSQLQNTHADGDRRIYARVGTNTFYRIDLANRCSALGFGGSHLVLTPTPGSDLICRPIDLDLKVSEDGAAEACFIQSITRLSPDEAAAIPRRVKP